MMHQRRNQQELKQKIANILVLFWLLSPIVIGGLLIYQIKANRSLDFQVRDLKQTQTEMIGEFKGIYMQIDDIREATKSATLKEEEKEAGSSAKEDLTSVPIAKSNNVGFTGNSGEWVGKVSHYSRAGCLGCSSTLTMANGEVLDDNRLTIAFNHLPMNSRVLLTNLDNGKSVEAVVTDTGGFAKYNRIADLTIAVANALGTKTDQSTVSIKAL